VLGYYHCIYARDEADYERQRADLIASGRAKPTELILRCQLAEARLSRRGAV
jgi:hypothetical protein